MGLTAGGRARAGWLMAGLLWLGGVVTGLAWLAGYDNRPGAPATAPATWPVESTLVREPSRPTVVMFAHPLCDCTRASLAELSELMARVTPAPVAYVVFVDPADFGRQWESAEGPKIAERMAGVLVRRDRGGVEARRFGAMTSGQALLYGVDGTLLFSGGATSARGHLGENAGLTAMMTLLNQRTPQDTKTPVFGCALFGPHDEPDPKR